MLVGGASAHRLAWLPASRFPHEEGALPMTEKFRITYATMSADNEELQAAYDAAAERARAELGKEYPVVVNGEERWREDVYAEPSPIDKEIVIGRFSQATPEDVEDAVAAAQGVPARVGPHGLAGARADPPHRRRHHGGARLRSRRPDGLRGRQEPARGARRRAGDRGADPLELRRDGEARRVPHADERARRGRRLLRRDAPARGLGRDQPVQLPDGAFRRALERRARRRQHASCSSRPTRARCSATSSTSATATAACRRARSTSCPVAVRSPATAVAATPT